MRNTSKRLTYFLLVILLLPAILFSVFEISSMNRDEEVIQEIYNNQLDAILFSLNQYSQDVVSSWTNEISMNLGADEGTRQSGLNEYLEKNPMVAYIFLASGDGESIMVYSLEDSINSKDMSGEVRGILAENDEKLKRLQTYLRGGFVKTEPLKASTLENLTSITFLYEVPEQSAQVCGIIISPDQFITEVMAPRMQSIGQEEFVISSFLVQNDQLVYSTQELDSAETLGVTKGQNKNVWLLPDYYFGISLVGRTIESIVQQRTFTNILLVVVLDLVLILGALFVVRNVRREIQLAQNKSDFVSNVSHEIRTPLSLISMFAETLQMGRVKTDDKKNEYYSIIGKEANRLTGLVNTILNFSKMEANKKVYHYDKVNLNDILRDILDSYEYHLGSKGFEYKIDLDESLEIVDADHDAVSEAVRNLLDNAVKYSNDNKLIEIRSGKEKQYAIIEVKDHGVGIPKVHQKHIFDKFYRVESGLVHNTKGTGLGLSLVKHIMDAHHGKVVIDSAEGKGSSFTLYFPITQTENGS